MKRDLRLHGLSAEHHHALVLARKLRRHDGVWTQEDGVGLKQRFDEELDPHFLIEEEVLLPALRIAGATALADRTVEDHEFLRNRVEVARIGDPAAAYAFAVRLHAHVRFEERELFPACELLADEILDEVMRRSPKKGKAC